MQAIVPIAPWLAAMVILIGFSGFFSASEAALFCLRWPDRRALAAGSRAQRLAEHLLSDPDRLLTAVLFWNLVANVTYFAIATIAAAQLVGTVGRSVIVGFTFGSILVLIFFSEMLPKSLAVLWPGTFSTLVSIPLAAAVRAVDPILPALRLVKLVSRRLIWPRIEPEPYLEVADLERAIELSTTDAQLLHQEQMLLRNIVSLSEIRVDEWMRPRKHFRVFRPPVALADIRGRMTPSGYLFMTEHNSDEVAASLSLRELSEVPQEHLEYAATPVVYVPWCATVADALEQLHSKSRQAATVVNELGETIGVLTLEDIFDTVFTERAEPSERLLNRHPIQPLGPNGWQVTGMTNVRRLARYFDVDLPPSRSVTIGGVVQETLERIPAPGDECRWGPLALRVIDAPDGGPLLVHLTLERGQEEAP